MKEVDDSKGTRIKFHPFWILIQKIKFRMSDRYPMTYDQPAQIDCRRVECRYYKGSGVCSNISPALTLNTNGTFVCWSEKSDENKEV